MIILGFANAKDVMQYEGRCNRNNDSVNNKAHLFSIADSLRYYRSCDFASAEFNFSK